MFNFEGSGIKQEMHKLDEYHFKCSEIIINFWVMFHFEMEHITSENRFFNKSHSRSSSGQTSC